MLIAVETATQYGGVALLEGERIVAEEAIDQAQQQASLLLPRLHALLDRCGYGLQDVARIALSIGPGSFTGLRVGLATALGLCLGSGRRIVPVPTLAVLALQAGECPRIAPMLDARKGQVYAGLYAPGGVPLESDCVSDPGPWLETLRSGGPVSFLGRGAQLYAQEIKRIVGQAAQILPAEQGWPRAASVGILGVRQAQREGDLAPDDVELRYLRTADAESTRRGGHAAGKAII